MNEPHDRLARLTAHHADCDACQSAPLPLEHIAVVLDGSVPDLDAAALSRQAFAQLRPQLQRRALAVGWKRLAARVLLALLPLPLVLAYDAYILRVAYDLLSALVPTTVAAYLVLSYGAALVLLFATTYAAIPVLMVQRPTPQPPLTA